MTWRAGLVALSRPAGLCASGLAFALAAGPAAAGESTLTPDRPSVANGPDTVPLGAIQIETGVAYEASRVAGSATERRTSLAVTLRAGLGERIEARIESEPFVHLRADREDTGPGDVTLGLKYRFLDAAEGQWWPALGIQPFVKLPAAAEPIGSGRPDFGALAVASLSLPADLDLEVNAGLVAVGQGRPSGYLLQAVAAAALSRRLTDRVSVYGEVFFASRGERGGRDTLGVDAGLTYFITPWLAVDGAVETTLRGSGPDYGVRAGVSVRFGGR